jgi:hypothetical protein
MIRILVMVAAVSVVAVPAVEGQNLVPNPGFDTDTLGTDWVNYSADSMQWLGTDGNVSGSGNGCVEFGTTSNNGGVVNVGTSLVAVTENTEYLVSGVARVPSDSVDRGPSSGSPGSTISNTPSARPRISTASATTNGTPSREP